MDSFFLSLTKETITKNEQRLTNEYISKHFSFIDCAITTDTIPYAKPIGRVVKIKIS